VAGRFCLYTDTDVDGPVVKALRNAFWDIVRGIDAFPEKTSDIIHFEHAAQEGRVLVSNDLDMKIIAEGWCAEGRTFAGLIWWPRSHYDVMSPGDFVAAFEALVGQAEPPFSAYPIVHLPKR
jgi:Domain of unknown function (DUF5615)